MLTDHERETIEAMARAISSRRLDVSDDEGCFPYVVFIGLVLAVLSLWRIEEKLDRAAHQASIRMETKP